VFFLDVWKIHRARWLYLLWSEARQKRIDELENMRKPSEQISAWEHQKPTNMR
jgi:hypothetical protein